MRVVLWLVALFATIESAAADSPRYHPAAGTTVTLRGLITSHVGQSFEQTTGFVYRLKTIASDEATAENTRTPLAMLWRCPEGDVSDRCKQAQNAPDARRDGDLITVSVPSDIAASLAALSKSTMEDFLRHKDVIALPGFKDMHEIAKPEWSASPLTIATSGLDCDEGALKRFLPLGAVAEITVPCQQTIEYAQSRVPAVKDFTSTPAVSYQLSFAGRQDITVSAGKFPVAVVKFKCTYAADDGPFHQGDPCGEGEWAIAENLGYAVKSSTSRKTATTAVNTEVELVKIEH